MKNKFLILSFIALGFAVLYSTAEITGQEPTKTPMQNFKQAAAENNKLQSSMAWTLSKKAQKGWYLYVPLIKNTLKIEAEADTPEFAEAVAVWQKSNNLKADGILEEKTLWSFIAFWQSQRIKPIVEATEDQLLSAPISNFYDQTRATSLLKVEKETFAAYKQMLKAAIEDKSLGLKVDEKGNLKEDELFLKLISTYRSLAYQAELRKKEPNASNAQIAFVSPHFTGRALDIYVGGEPVITKDKNRAIQIKTKAYLWLVKNAEKFGFYPYFYEPWHWEYVGTK